MSQTFSLAPSSLPVNPVFAFHSYLMAAEFFLGNHHLPKTPPPPPIDGGGGGSAGRSVGRSVGRSGIVIKVNSSFVNIIKCK